MSVNHQFADQIIHQKINKWMLAQKSSHNQTMISVHGNLLKSANEIKTIIQECSPERGKKIKNFSTPTPFSLTERKTSRNPKLIRTPEAVSQIKPSEYGNQVKSPDY